MADITKGRKEIGPAKCRWCSRPVPREKGQHVKIGGFKYHEECAEKKPRARQRWEPGVGWIRL